VSEVRHRLTQISYLLLPKVRLECICVWCVDAQSQALNKGLISIGLQTYLADINIVPDLTLSDYSQLLSNPSHARLAHCIRAGELATFKKLAQIRDGLAIECALDKAVKLAAVAAMKTGGDVTSVFE
jgi:hypothetical protein